MSWRSAVGLGFAVAFFCAGSALAPARAADDDADSGRNDLGAGSLSQPHAAARNEDPSPPAAKFGPTASVSSSDADDDKGPPRKTFMNFYAKHVAPKLPPKPVDDDPEAQPSPKPPQVKPAAAAAQPDPDDAEPAAPASSSSAKPAKPHAAAAKADADDDRAEAVDPAAESAEVKAVTSFALSHPQAGKINPLWAIPMETLRATRERPLFSASRRPPAAPVRTAAPVVQASAPAEPAPPERPQLKLVGVVHGAKDDMAIFFDQAGKSVVRLHVGEANEAGWKIKSVDLRAATLEKDNEAVTLALPARSDESAGAANAGALALSNPIGGDP